MDQSRAAVPGASITIVHATMGFEYASASDERGAFKLLLLPVGTYELRVELTGFRPVTQVVSVGVGQAINVRLVLNVEGVAETVAVTSQSPILETSRSQVSSSVDDTTIHNLPIMGRNFVDFTLQTPGVTRDANTGDLSFAGQRSFLNSLVVDGVDNNNTFFGQSLGRVGSGRAPYQFSLEAVKEFQVTSNGFLAEYGRSGGGVINVVTKSGANALSGSAFEYYRDKALNASGIIALQNGQPKSPYHYHQFGGTTGGPIRSNKDFFLRQL